MTKYILLLCFILCSSASFAKVETGLDVLNAKRFLPLQKKRIGFICNHTSRNADGKFGADVLLDAKLTVAAFFSPEHGFDGIRKAGVTSDSASDYRGVPIHSLYGANRKPTKKMLAGIDVLVFDMQDIGVRPYTYLSTMINAMEAAAANSIEFVVLDRPNPLGGERIEGNILDSSLLSFVGIAPIPYLHGMTLGELAQMAKGERWFSKAEKLDLTIISMNNWHRNMIWSDTKLEWKATSPNIPTPQSAVGCAMLGAIGELGILSIGLHTDAPFLRIGSRLIKSDSLLPAAKKCFSNGINIFIEHFTAPFGDTIKSYNGIRFQLPKNVQKIDRLYGPAIMLLSELLRDTNLMRSYNALPFSTLNMFDKVTGSKEIRKGLTNREVLREVMKSWKYDESAFREKRKKYLLY